MQPNQSLELEIPTAKSKRGGITFAAPAEVSATLIDADGETIGENPAGTPEANNFFRYIVVDKPVKAGTWKLKLENTGEKETEVWVIPVFDTNPLNLEFTEIKIQDSGRISLRAKLTNEANTVKGATVTVKVQGQDKEINLVDDGTHNDGGANDGMYGGLTEILQPAEYSIEAKANAGGLNVTTSTALTVGKPN